MMQQTAQDAPDRLHSVQETPSTMKVLFVNPHFPNSYWSGRSALEFAQRESLLPPLPLITVAALLPQDWEMRLIDMDVQLLSDEDLLWADVVMLTGMLVQTDSLHEVLARCRKLGIRTVVGGPYATALPDEVASRADTVVVGECELTVQQLAQDILAGDAKPRYEEPLIEDPRNPGEWIQKKPDMTTVPTPRYDLLDISKYHQMSLQSSRGCPFQCEFCDIIVMFGRVPRYKMSAQIIRELEAIKATGFRGTIFLVDDNFIGNKKLIKTMLPEIAAWRNERGHALDLYTEASLDLAGDAELIRLMTSAGFTSVFIGLESPNPESLKETKKFQNIQSRSMLEQIHFLQKKGLDVWAGFILGFDSDTSNIFDQMIEFIHTAGIPYAMVGMLGALPNTPLFKQLQEQGRILHTHSGDQFGVTNFVTKLPALEMATGYLKVIDKLYSAQGFFSRCRKNLTWWKPVRGSSRTFTQHDLYSGMRAIRYQGFQSQYRFNYWMFLAWVALRHPTKVKRALQLAAAGHHYFTFTRDVVLPGLRQQIELLKHQRPKITATASP